MSQGPARRQASTNATSQPQQATLMHACPEAHFVVGARLNGAKDVLHYHAGRAINLGAAVGPDGQAWELQLKVSAAVCVYRNIETGARWWGTVVKVTIIHMGMS